MQGIKYKYLGDDLKDSFESLFFIFNVEYFRNVSNKRNEQRLNHRTNQVTRAYTSSLFKFPQLFRTFSSLSPFTLRTLQACFMPKSINLSLSIKYGMRVFSYNLYLIFDHFKGISASNSPIIILYCLLNSESSMLVKLYGIIIVCLNMKVCVLTTIQAFCEQD